MDFSPNGSHSERVSSFPHLLAAATGRSSPANNRNILSNQSAVYDSYRSDGTSVLRLCPVMPIQSGNAGKPLRMDRCHFARGSVYN